MNDQLFQTVSGAAGTSSTYATIGDILLNARFQELLIEVANGGTSGEDLTNFNIQRQAPGSANFVDWIAGTDFDLGSSALTDVLRESGTDSDGGGLYVKGLPDGTHCQLRINVRGVHALRFQAMTASSTPTITITTTAVTF